MGAEVRAEVFVKEQLGFLCNVRKVSLSPEALLPMLCYLIFAIPYEIDYIPIFQVRNQD